MTQDQTESLLRDSLRAHLDDVANTVGGDPWQRVAVAHRRSRGRRRAAALAGLVAVTVIGGSLAVVQPWQSTAGHAQPADPDDGSGDSDLGRQLLVGPSRGALGADSQLRQDVVTSLDNSSGGGLRLAEPSTLKVLWADLRGGRRLALVDSIMTMAPTASSSAPLTTEVGTWLDGPARGGPMSVLSQGSLAQPISARIYLDANGAERAVAVVRHGATVAESRAVITSDGRIQHLWRPVAPVQDGVVDLPVTDLMTRGPITLSARVGTGRPVYLSTASPDFSNDSQPTMLNTGTDIDAALNGARGPGAGRSAVVQRVETLIQEFSSNPAYITPHVEWAGTMPASRGGGSLIAVSAGLAGQGRLMEIVRQSPAGRSWHHWVTLPLGEGPGQPGWARAWRLPSQQSSKRPAGPAKQIVNWFFGTDFTSVEVTVDGIARPAITQDGMGWIEVTPGQDVTVTGHRSAGVAQLVLHPDDVEPVPTDANGLWHPLWVTR
jgi:hypothetical protein